VLAHNPFFVAGDVSKDLGIAVFEVEEIRDVELDAIVGAVG
jgi:hypothetical protein